jgi:hypothetical protein
MKLINYYYSYLTEISGDEPLDLSGILLTPTLVDNKIIWLMENPNNKSYSKYGIEGFVDDLLMDFSNKTAGEFYDKLYRKQSINIEKELYLTEEFKNKLLNLAQKKTKFDYASVISDMWVFKINYYIENDRFVFQLSIELSNPKDSDTYERISFAEVEDRYHSLSDDDGFENYTDETFSDLMNFIWNSPTIFDKQNMFIQIFIQFYTDKGQKIRHY